MSHDLPPSSPAVSVALLGADAVLAALPATPVQLAHACRALGYDMAFPASWGDELVAEACLSRVASLGSEPAILCACPHVARRLASPGQELAPWMLMLPAPPVAAARYLRAAYGDRTVHITFVGACPSGEDPSIDARERPESLFAAFAERGIALGQQPVLFDSLIPPDRRRFHSVPGGAPSAERLAAVDPRRALVELEGDDYPAALAERLLVRQRTLIDLAPQLGCTCSGVLVAGAAHGARAALMALEPPRATAPVLDASLQVDLTAPSAASYAPPSVEPTAPAPAVHAPVAPAAVTPATAPCSPHIAPVLRRRDGTWVPRAFARFSARDAARDPSDAAAPARGAWSGSSSRGRAPVIPLAPVPRPLPPPPIRHAKLADAIPETGASRR